MTPDQCVEMMEALRDAYKKISRSTKPAKEEVLKLKNVLLQIELCMVSMRLSVDSMLKLI
tara:strand:+ start:79 stop:258 length:180 start_codon:yes stop_codon:yes gene_type:complete